MRKLILVALTLFPALIMAQFKLTDMGFRDSLSGESYIVKEFPGKTAHELYNNMLTTLNNIYKGSDQIAKVEDKSIVVDASERLPLMKRHSYTVSYKLSFYFKDGKIKMAAPSVGSMIGIGNYGLRTMGISKEHLDNAEKYIFKKGSLDIPQAKETMDLFFKAIYLVVFNSNNSDW